LAGLAIDTARVDRYWRETFGLSEADYRRPGVVVCPHSQKLAGRNACWVFLHAQTCLVSTPAPLVAEIRRRAQRIPLETMLDEETLYGLFPERVARTVGPSYQGFTEAEGFRPYQGPTVRRVSPSERIQVRQFLSECAPQEREDSGLHEDAEPLFAGFDGTQLVALGGVLACAPYAANPGVIAHPLRRGRGFGKAVASAAMAYILTQGQVVLYQTLLSNRAAVAIAKALGCQSYARMVYIGLR